VSFRGRLALFFVLIVVIPIAAIALLVFDVSRESQSANADASLSTGVSTALSVYERDVEAAGDAVTELLEDQGIAAALQTGDPRQIESAAGAAGGDAGIERLSVEPPNGAAIEAIGTGEQVATATVRTTGRAGRYVFTGSVTSPDRYVQEITELTGLDAALVGDQGLIAGAPGANEAELPRAGSSGDVEIQGETLRAASALLPEGASTRVVVITGLEAGGFFDSRPRIFAALAIFLAIAIGFILVVFRALQGQIGSMLEAARRIGSGDFSGRVPVVGKDEMAGLATEFNTMSDRLEAQIAQLRSQRTELDSMVTRLGEAVASGLDQAATLGIVAEAALGGCSATYALVSLNDGTVIERERDLTEPAKVATLAGQKRATQDGTQVIARRDAGHALAAPLERDGFVAGTLAVGREGSEFDAREREVFVILLEKASTSIENITAHERVSEQAVTDELTGLANNRSFRETLEREAARAKRFGHELSLIILDLDEFKVVNDTHGHLQGDEVLRLVGRILQSEPRAIDEAARYGGEEFVVALPETGPEGAVELAERIRMRLEGEAVASADGGEAVRVTASFGTATMPGAAEDARHLFEAADEALYEAKRQGKNRVVTAPVAARSHR